MSSIRKKPLTKFWYACFTLPNGRRVQRSTKETDRKKAQKLADQWEAVTKGRVRARQAQKVIADIYSEITGEHLTFPSVRDYFESWLENKKPEVSESSFAFYQGKARSFLTWLGGRADDQLTLIEKADIIALRDYELKRVSRKSTRHAIKFLRMVFKTAKSDGKYREENPAIDVKVKLQGDSERRAFTIPEIRRVLQVAGAEWRSLICFGLYTGQRLGDLARLTWANVDLERNEIRLRARKTGRTTIIPIASPLRAEIEKLQAGDDPREPLHPCALASVEKNGGVNTLSRQFGELLADAGLAEHKPHRKTKAAPGRSGRRTISEISFHSLRHTATSLMKNAGISAAVVQDIIGHDSEAMSDHYTHVDEETKRGALAKIPDVLSAA